MFLCAIVHPRFNPSANSWWDGKLGIWPIGDWEPAKGKSKNRLRGTLINDISLINDSTRVDTRSRNSQNYL